MWELLQLPKDRIDLIITLFNYAQHTVSLIDKSENPQGTISVVTLFRMMSQGFFGKPDVDEPDVVEKSMREEKFLENVCLNIEKIMSGYEKKSESLKNY